MAEALWGVGVQRVAWFVQACGIRWAVVRLSLGVLAMGEAVSSFKVGTVEPHAVVEQLRITPIVYMRSSVV